MGGRAPSVQEGGQSLGRPLLAAAPNGGCAVGYREHGGVVARGGQGMAAAAGAAAPSTGAWCRCCTHSPMGRLSIDVGAGSASLTATCSSTRPAITKPSSGKQRSSPAAKQPH